MYKVIDKERELKQLLLCTLSIAVEREVSLNSGAPFNENLAGDLDYLEYILRAFLNLKDGASFSDYRQELITKIINSSLVVDGYSHIDADE